jgi:hypothetical protein
MIVVGLVLAVCAGGCLDSSSTGQTHQHHGPPRTQPNKNRPSGQPSSAGQTANAGAQQAKRWHRIILLRRHIEHVRYAALQLAPPHADRLRDRYPEFRTTSTKRLGHILGHWQARLSRW